MHLGIINALTTVGIKVQMSNLLNSTFIAINHYYEGAWFVYAMFFNLQTAYHEIIILTKLQKFRTLQYAFFCYKC